MATSGVSIRMVRNFGIRKTRLLRPTRRDQWTAGPGLSRRTATAIASSTGESATSPARDAAMSKARFSASASSL